MHRLQELVRLYREGKSAREVTRLLKMGPNTERKYREALAREGLLDLRDGELPDMETLKAAVLKHHPPQLPPQQKSTLEAWHARVEELVAKGLGPQAIRDRFALEDPEFAGTLSAIKRLCRRIKREKGVDPNDVAIPVETLPGEVAQVDFGYVGRLYDPDAGALRKAWVFVMVLGYSRHLVARVVFDQRSETWLDLHAQAFRELGGVVQTVVPDNLKSAVVRAAFGFNESPELNRSYREVARYYGFIIDPTPAYSPKKKGKVESAVKYVKRNFFRGREGEDVTMVRSELARWVKEIAGHREHGTTGKRPLEVFDQYEQAVLRPLPARPYEPVVWKRATVHRDSHVSFERRLYSVPWKLIGQAVWLQASTSTVSIYADDERVAVHSRRGRALRSTVESHLPEARSDLRHRSRAYWEKRADAMGQDVGVFIREVFDSDDVLSQLRAVQAIVTHLEGYPLERAQAACRRARYYGNYTYKGLKSILRQALDLQPLPVASSPPEPVVAPRFARNVEDLFLSRGGAA